MGEGKEVTEQVWVPIVEHMSTARAISARKVLARSHLTWRWVPTDAGDRLDLRLDPESQQAYEIAEETVHIYDVMIKTATDEGISIKPYKPLEPEILIIAAEVALRDSPHWRT